MTPEELQELRDWAARKMGWKETYYTRDLSNNGYRAMFPFYSNDGKTFCQDIAYWKPDRPESGQIWMLVERMMELGWYLYIEPEPNQTFPGFPKKAIIYEIGFYHPERLKKGIKPNRCYGMFEEVSCLSILRAARATEEE